MGKKKQAPAPPSNSGAAPARDSRGRFLPGAPWNPAGPKPGYRQKGTLLADALLHGQAGAVAQKMIERALAGSDLALKLAIERVLPVARDRPIKVALPKIETAADVAAAMAAVVERMAAGEVSPGEALVMAQVFEVRRRSIETNEQEERLRELERAADDGGHRPL